MDPLDREKPWSIPGQLAAITLAIGLLYAIVRFAVVVPDWGWQLILAATGVGVVLYYLLAFRLGVRRPATVRAPLRQRTLEFLTALLLVVVLTLPVALLLFGWTG